MVYSRNEILKSIQEAVMILIKDGWIKEIPLEKITPSTNLQADLGIDSDLGEDFIKKISVLNYSMEAHFVRVALRNGCISTVKDLVDSIQKEFKEVEKN